MGGGDRAAQHAASLANATRLSRKEGRENGTVREREHVWSLFGGSCEWPRSPSKEHRDDSFAQKPRRRPKVVGAHALHTAAVALETAAQVAVAQAATAAQADAAGLDETGAVLSSTVEAVVETTAEDAAEEATVVPPVEGVAEEVVKALAQPAHTSHTPVSGSILSLERRARRLDGKNFFSLATTHIGREQQPCGGWWWWSLSLSLSRGHTTLPPAVVSTRLGRACLSVGVI